MGNWKLGCHLGGVPTPVFSASVASKGVSCTATRLNATLTGFCVSVADKGVRGRFISEIPRQD